MFKQSELIRATIEVQFALESFLGFMGDSISNCQLIIRHPGTPPSPSNVVRERVERTAVIGRARRR